MFIFLLSLEYLGEYYTIFIISCNFRIYFLGVGITYLLCRREMGFRGKAFVWGYIDGGFGV